VIFTWGEVLQFFYELPPAEPQWVMGVVMASEATVVRFQLIGQKESGKQWHVPEQSETVPSHRILVLDQDNQSSTTLVPEPEAARRLGLSVEELRLLWGRRPDRR
jgi:hypothetical protein